MGVKFLISLWKPPFAVLLMKAFLRILLRVFPEGLEEGIILGALETSQKISHAFFILTKEIYHITLDLHVEELLECIRLNGFEVNPSKLVREPVFALLRSCGTGRVTTRNFRDNVAFQFKKGSFSVLRTRRLHPLKSSGWLSMN